MKRAILAAALASVVSMAGCAATSGHAKGERLGDETKITLAECPRAVSRTFNAEVRDGQIKEVSRESEDGKTVYSADATIDGKDYEIKVAEDGTLLSKELDADEQKGDADKGAKAENKSGESGAAAMGKEEEKGGKPRNKDEAGTANDKGGKGEDDKDDDEDDD